MNKISLFLYFADVLSGLGGALFALMLISAIAFGALLVCYGCAVSHNNDNIRYPHMNADRRDRDTPRPKWFMVAGASFLLALFAGVFVPSKTTIYAIAASELGESVASSAEGREMIDDTKQILREYLKSLKKEKS